jgi:hypothetical protein
VNAARSNKKGPACCQPLSSVALACVDARERIVLPLEAGSYIFLAFFFAFFAICSSCASDTSYRRRHRRLIRNLRVQQLDSAKNPNHSRKLNIHSGKY